MRPASISASAITAFESCPAYYKAKSFDRVADIRPSAPGNLGTAVHAALERYVHWVYIQRMEPPNLPILLDAFRQEFTTLFGHAENDLYGEGCNMLEDWYYSNPFEGVQQVLSVEEKNSFDLPTPYGPLKVNYIFDRLDLMRVTPGEPLHYRVVDYKSQRWGYNPDVVRKMIQARLYALAVQLEFGQEREIVVEVQMDLLRHARVSAFFTREDNQQTWKKLLGIVREIYLEDDENPKRKINPFCRYCPIAATCPTLLDNKAQGGFQVVGTDTTLAAEMIYHIDNQMKGLESLRDQVEDVLLKYAEEQELIGWDDGDLNVKVTAGKRRSAESERLIQIIGPELTRKYGKIGVTAIDAMIKNGELTEEQIIEAKKAIGTKFGQPTIKVERKTPFEE